MKELRESVILIPTPVVEPTVGEWRKKYDSVSLHGIPSHITTLFPFKNPDAINDGIINQIKTFFSKVSTFEFSLTKINTFPGVVYLEPEPREKFIEISKGIINMFPENPWFEGKFKEIKPHLTIGNKLQNLELAKNEIFKDIALKLPIKTLATEAWLMESKNDEWSIREKFPFAL